MFCPVCESKTKTLETRIYNDPKHVFEYVERRRKCLDEECEHIFKTVEVSSDTWERMTK